MVWTLVALFLTIAPLAPPKDVAPPEPLSPTSGWNLDYGENACALSMDFGHSGEAAWTFGVQPLLGNPVVRLVAHLPNTEGLGRSFRSGTGSVRLGNGPPVEARYESYALAGDTRRAYDFYVDLDQLGGLATATDVTLIPARRDGWPMRFALVHTGQADAAIKICETDLRKSWALASVIARGDETPRLVSAGSHDFGAVAPAFNGTVGIVFEINEGGRIDRCRVAYSSGADTQDAAICDMITRSARYRPVMDKDGNATRSWGSRWVVWRIPER